MEFLSAFIFFILFNTIINNRRFTKLECKIDYLNDTIEKLNSRIDELSNRLSKYE